MSVWSQVADSYWELDLSINLKGREHTSLHLGLVSLVVKPQLGYHHNLEVDPDILYLVSFVQSVVIFNLIPLYVMELTNLIQSVDTDLLEPLSVLLGRNQIKLVVDVSDEVDFEAKLLVLYVTVLDEDASV
jgi:hypothetical protein